VHPETRDRGGFDITPAVDFWDLTNRQDWVLCERVQKGTSSTVYQPGPYSNREELLWAFDRWVVERVGE
jgi:Rieske 2Fe-2S family protein